MTSLPVILNPTDHVLVASPSNVVRQRVLENLPTPVRRVEHARGGAEALGHLESGHWQVLFLDRSLPDLNAEELSQIIKQKFPAVAVVMLDSESDAAEKPVAVPSIEQDEMPRPPRHPARATATNSAPVAPLPGMVGASWAMQPLYRGARLLARRNTTVLITGPTGSGKELVARGI